MIKEVKKKDTGEMGLKIIKVVTGKKVGGNLGFFFFSSLFQYGGEIHKI